MQQFKTGLIYFIILASLACKNKPMSQTNTSIETFGRYLFFDTHLSINHTKSCGSCHAPQLAFTDGYRRSVSPLGENLLHNSPSLLNTYDYLFYDWANPTATSYIQQMQRPLYNHQPIELGLDQHWDEVTAYITSDSTYASLYSLSFPKEHTSITKPQLEFAISAYLKSLKSQNSAYDQYMKGDKEAMSHSAIAGLQLFASNKLACVQCHKPPSFTLASSSKNLNEVYINIGLYKMNTTNEYPENDAGLFHYTHNKNDDGKFKIPSLRNVAITSPYMHDGSMITLNEIIDLYASGGRNIEKGKLKGDGRAHKNKHSLIHGFEITKEEKIDLINFLIALTDTSYLSNEHFLNPFRNK